MPVVWATQVLDGLTRSGRPSRAEVTDVAMGVRAECVMLKKGPHAAEAVCFLADILQRMQQHHSKKRSFLRRLSVSNLSRKAGSIPCSAITIEPASNSADPHVGLAPA